MISKIFSFIFNTIVVLLVTCIGIILRGIQLYCYQGDEKGATGSIVLFVLSIIFYILGFLCTRSFLNYTLLENESIPEAIISVILSIALPIFFMYYTPAGMFVGEIVMTIITNIISCIIAVVVIIFVFAMLSSGGDSVDPPPKENKSESSYDRWEREKKEREQYVRDNWDSSLGRLNSDATMYETPDGNWNKISRDGQHYEDDYGDWQHI